MCDKFVSCISGSSPILPGVYQNQTRKFSQLLSASSIQSSYANSFNKPTDRRLRPVVAPALVGAPKLNQPPRTQDVTAPQQGRHVDVERAVRLRAAEEHADGAHALEHAVGGRPGILEQVEADLAVLQRNVWVDDLRGEAHLRWSEGVFFGDGDGDEPAAACSFWLAM